MKSAKLIACAALAAAASAFAAKPIKVISNASLPCSATSTFSRDTVYHLSGRVFVGQSAACPQELVIQSGTVVKGLLGEQGNVSVLVITRWGKIKALGTAADPILFTTVLDNEDDPTDLGPFDRYMWGGIILLGNATISEDSAYIEGINNEPRGAYGGHNDLDSSGEMHYVSIRHGGKIIGNDNEINGLTFGGVGSKTVIDHIEVFANGDDGFEWFGGTVNAKYLVSAYGNDDGFDFDFGFRGKLQYGLMMYSNANPDANGNQAIEGDGFAFPLNSGGAGAGLTDTTKYSSPKFSNLTLIGNGSTVPSGFTFVNDLAFRLRDGTGGDFKNMILANFPQNLGRFELQGSLACDAVCKVNNGLLNFEANYVWNFGNWIGGSLSDMMIGGNGAAEVDGNDNQYVNPLLNSMPNGSNWRLNTVDPRPAPTSPAVTGAHHQMGDAFFDNVTYAGAFSPTAAAWTDGWTAVSQMGIAKKYIVFQPAGGSKSVPAKLWKPGVWDFVMTQTGLNGAINVNASEAYLDGADVSSTFRSGIFPFPTVLANGDRVYKAAGQTGAVFGASGKHSLRVKLVIAATGQIIDETTYWETFP
ncbi:MAG TPA: hypothetical protein VJ385_04625 [Fibrobacteria bacterium]|nr:hypothetical protein [Fibrobacteria bacterium]